MVSLARGAASPFKMRGFAERRANQLTIGKKFLSREAASAAREFKGSRFFNWTHSLLPNLF
jgi:hypothetical protein